MSERLPRFLLALILFGLSAGHPLGAQQPALRIAAAADLQPLLPAVTAEFQKQTGLTVEATYASSATLAEQIINGAPFDLFLAADISFPKRVIAAGLADRSQPLLYARGTLVLWARNDSPIRNHGKVLSIDLLRNVSTGKVAVANAEHAPYGRAAMAAIEDLGLTNALKDRLVIAENIAQAAQYAESANAEAGFLSLTSAITPRLQAAGSYVEVPANAYPPILQGAVVIKNSPGSGTARRFLDFLASATVRRQLADGGLKAP